MIADIADNKNREPRRHLKRQTNEKSMWQQANKTNFRTIDLGTEVAEAEHA